jgi:hypothetical protein
MHSTAIAKLILRPSKKVNDRYAVATTAKAIGLAVLQNPAGGSR